ncbi:TPA: DUF1610 domain-containing protein [archaeon]|uniref:DUF1610 domain-containing protein n=1 Tax=Candidatus Naiadarchaeum limnaeum TaxID=2756139 RepID=A0A832V499_9ARCH|nr:DUF1610 domain-containing protein [Candidatus Naiadarchaeales archaeon SRR2090153.bin1042]HIK00672.1 DUF1610 domain-containing protein [Candidatus Naiadarchaeum limnaeum]
MKTVHCTSCGTELRADTSSVELICPSCGKNKIGRCGRCKKLSREYTCECGFVGP